MDIIIYNSTSLIGSRVVYHKKSADLVTGSFLLRVVTLSSELSSGASILIQPRLIEEVVFVQIMSISLRLLDEAGSAFLFY
jgi:hypothetical protein